MQFFISKSTQNQQHLVLVTKKNSIY